MRCIIMQCRYLHDDVLSFDDAVAEKGSQCELLRRTKFERLLESILVCLLAVFFALKIGFWQPPKAPFQ